MTAAPLVRTEVDGGIAVISYNRPEKHNALNDAMVAQWHEAMTEAIASPEVRVIVLRGEGRSFSSGRDTTELGRRQPGDSDHAFVRRAQERALTRLESPKPIVAAVKGYTLGGALETALTADLRVAADDVRMGFPEIRYGLVTDTGGIPLTTRLAGPSRAKYLVMTGELIDAEQALAWGLVDFVVPAAELDDRVMALARRLAQAPPLAVAMVKQIVDVVGAGEVRAGLHAELLAQTALFSIRGQRPEPGRGEPRVGR